MIYVTLPEQFVALKRYPGYFWHLVQKEMTTIPVDNYPKGRPAPLTADKDLNIHIN